MRVLFYVEPLIEMGRPYWKGAWSNVYCLELAQTLRQSQEGGRFHFRMVLSEALEQRYAGQAQVPAVVATQEELLAPFSGNYLDAMRAWYERAYTDAQCAHYHRLFQNKLDGFTPDLIISFTPAPFFRTLFPKALLLQHEFALFSRAPYLPCRHLDPLGSVGSSFLTHFADAIRAERPSPEAVNALRSFKQAAQDLIRARSPFAGWLQSARGHFAYLLLLPLQFSGYYAFDCLAPYSSQYDYLIRVLNQVPRSIGVVVTQHPEYQVLEPDTIEFLRHKYPHFLYHESFEDYYAASQYLIAGVDGLATVSSTMAYQALIWDKKLFALGKGFCQWFADQHRLEHMEETLAQPPADRDGILCWMLTHYALPDPYLKSPEWLARFLTASADKYRGHIDFDFYPLIDEPARLFSVLRSGLDASIPHPTERKRSRERKAVETGAWAGGGLQARVNPGPKFALSIILPVHNRPAYTKACLDAIAASVMGDSMELILVDNGSDADTAGLLWALEGDVQLLRNPRNLGFAQACNQAASLARGEHLWILHNDTEPQAGCLENLLTALQGDAATGAAGPMLVFPDGRLQAQGGAIHADGTLSAFAQISEKDKFFNPLQPQVDFCSSACLLIRRAAFEQAGGFNPEFGPTLYADADLALRLRQGGQRVRLNIQALAVHHGNLATSLTPAESELPAHPAALFLEKWGRSFHTFESAEAK